MLTLCFTSVAAAQMRRIRKARPGSVVRSVRTGLALVLVFAVSGMAHAGGKPSGKSFGGMAGGNSGARMQISNSIKLNNIQSNSNSMGYQPGRTVQLDKKINGLGNVLGNSTPRKIDGLKDVISKQDPKL